MATSWPGMCNGQTSCLQNTSGELVRANRLRMRQTSFRLVYSRGCLKYQRIFGGGPGCEIRLGGHAPIDVGTSIRSALHQEGAIYGGNPAVAVRKTAIGEGQDNVQQFGREPLTFPLRQRPVQHIMEEAGATFRKSFEREAAATYT